jgi:hypothetical protein
MALVTLNQAKRQLRIAIPENYEDEIEDENADVQDKIDQASEIVLDFIKQRDSDWTDPDGDNAAPALIQAAVLLILTALYDDRSGPTVGELLTSPNGSTAAGSVAALLWRYRDPALA